MLIALPAALCLAAWSAVQLSGGYQAVRLRGFTLGRVADLGQAERMAQECVGLDFRTARRAFNDEASWRLWKQAGDDDVPWPPCDWGRRPAIGSPDNHVWMYEVDSCSKVFLFVEAGMVVGASGN